MIRARAILVLLVAAMLAWAAPLLGLVAAGRSVSAHVSFPPRAAAVAHAPFDWAIFVALSLPLVAAVTLYVAAIPRAGPRKAPGPRVSGRLPWWGWLGVALIAAGWSVSWTEGLVEPSWRRHTFTPLWLGYVLLLNGLAHRRTGHCLLTRRSAWFLALFPLSAGFWWLFEYLNQFVGNWHYSGIHAQSDTDYFLQGTLPFSTVLPAVASTWFLLRTYPRLEALELPALHGGKALAWLAVIVGMLSLGGMAAWPEAFFSALWLGPLLILAGLQQLVLGESLFSRIRHGDWRALLQPALAALICGFFWELWNFGSAARWHYSIPYVQRFHLFEMPLLGYAGYLPFGLECALVMDIAARLIERRRLYEAPPAS